MNVGVVEIRRKGSGVIGGKNFSFGWCLDAKDSRPQLLEESKNRLAALNQSSRAFEGIEVLRL